MAWASRCLSLAVLRRARSTARITPFSGRWGRLRSSQPIKWFHSRFWISPVAPSPWFWLSSSPSGSISTPLSPIHQSKLNGLRSRSEERRVGKECRFRGTEYHEKKNNNNGDSELTCDADVE